MASDQLSGALKSLFALAENYPKLKASENFFKLQQQLEGIENQIADRRELYNDSVNIYNTKIESIPDVVFAKLLGYTKEEYFKATEEEKKEVEVNLQ
ncbi:LemA family protein [Candidatus Micrarchaeota archaeon]|nr:LemA family protein [Candidatus Micrarchaeota archaeon]